MFLSVPCTASLVKLWKAKIRLAITISLKQKDGIFHVKICTEDNQEHLFFLWGVFRSNIHRSTVTSQSKIGAKQTLFDEHNSCTRKHCRKELVAGATKRH